jgi:hypothetical protein
MFAFAAMMVACGRSLEADLVSDDAGHRIAAIDRVRQLPADERARMVAFQWFA